MHHVQPIKPVAIYARISDDQEEEGKGVARQIRDGGTVASLRGWPTDKEHEYVDNDVSAYKRGVVRPEWERMMADLEAGVIGGVIVYDLDRFARQPKDLERALDIYTRNPDLVFATVQGDINLMTPDGITMARVMVAFANKASMDTARRVKRKHQEQAENGVPVGGWRSAGWQDDRITLDPFESELIKAAAKKIVAGVPVYHIVKEWNEAGFLTPHGNAWIHQTVKSLMLNERLAGFRNLRGKPVYTTDGTRARGQWDPILTPEEHEAVKAALAPDPLRPRAVHRNFGPRGTKKYLLSGIVQCGVCFGPLFGNANKAGGFVYTCPAPGKMRGSCGGVGINGVETDKHIVELFHLLGVERVAEEVDHAGLIQAAQARLEDVTAEIRKLGADFGAGLLPAEFVASALAPLNQRKAAIAKELDELHAAEMRAGIVTYLGGRPWEDLETDERRSLIASQFPTIIIKRAKSRGGRFDSERIVPSRTKVPAYGVPTQETAAQAAPSDAEPKPDAEHPTP